jgi:hypothetical protein
MLRQTICKNFYYEYQILNKADSILLCSLQKLGLVCMLTLCTAEWLQNLLKHFVRYIWQRNYPEMHVFSTSPARNKLL